MWAALIGTVIAASDHDHSRPPASHRHKATGKVTVVRSLIQTSTDKILYEPDGEASIPYPWEEHFHSADDETPTGDATETMEVKTFRSQCDVSDGHPVYYGTRSQ
jgi:hypothetical protein